MIVASTNVLALGGLEKRKDVRSGRSAQLQETRDTQFTFYCAKITFYCMSNSPAATIAVLEPSDEVRMPA